MWGFEHQKTIVIKEPYKTQLLEKLKMCREGKLSEEDLSVLKRQKQIMKKYICIWKDE